MQDSYTFATQCGRGKRSRSEVVEAAPPAPSDFRHKPALVSGQVGLDSNVEKLIVDTIRRRDRQNVARVKAACGPDSKAQHGWVVVLDPMQELAKAATG